MKLKILFSLSMMFFLATMAHAQTGYVYEYDDAGNRIQRLIREINMKTGDALLTDTLPFTEQLNNIEVKIYPNPTEGLLKLELVNVVDENNVTVKLFDMNGRQLLIQNISILAELDLSSFPTGKYILHILADGNTSSWAIIKE